MVFFGFASEEPENWDFLAPRIHIPVEAGPPIYPEQGVRG